MIKCAHMEDGDLALIYLKHKILKNTPGHTHISLATVCDSLQVCMRECVI